MIALALSVAAGGIGAVIVAHRQLAQRTSAGGRGAATVGNTATGPPATAFAPMTYDEATRSVVMFDGSHTWTWDGSRWHLLPTKTSPTSSGPGVTVTGTMAFDRQSQTVLLYVPGFQPGCIAPGDDVGYACGPYHDPATWSWNGADWRLLTVPTPDHAVGPAMDPTTGRPLLLTSTESACSTVMWTWSGSGWSRSGVAAPGVFTGSEQAALVTDPTSGHLLLVKSSTEARKGTVCSAENGTWEWDGSRWLRRIPGDPWPYPGQVIAVGSDPGAHQVVLFIQNAATWTWDGSAWTEHHPAHSPVDRIGPGMVYDPSRHQMLLVGGLPGVSGCFGGPADTWTWSGSDWTQLRPVKAHCARPATAGADGAP